MQVAVEKTGLNEVLIVKPQIFQDDRGFFNEVFRKDQYNQLGLPGQFVQFNHSGSVKDTVRGLHFQWDPPMGKLMRVSRGEAFLVAVDIRKGSPTAGRWFGRAFNDEEKMLLWAPAYFARGFAALSDFVEIEYLTTGIYNPEAESGILWNDPAIGIAWPVLNPILSKKDENAQTLEAWLTREESNFFRYVG
jgi:dTDP-4-dehydrorhamnose 3,5-epimerase